VGQLIIMLKEAQAKRKRPSNHWRRRNAWLNITLFIVVVISAVQLVRFFIGDGPPTRLDVAVFGFTLVAFLEVLLVCILRSAALEIIRLRSKLDDLELRTVRAAELHSRR